MGGNKRKTSNSAVKDEKKRADEVGKTRTRALGKERPFVLSKFYRGSQRIVNWRRRAKNPVQKTLSSRGVRGPWEVLVKKARKDGQGDNLHEEEGAEECGA